MSLFLGGSAKWPALHCYNKQACRRFIATESQCLSLTLDSPTPTPSSLSCHSESLSFLFSIWLPYFSTSPSTFVTHLHFIPVIVIRLHQDHDDMTYEEQQQMCFLKYAQVAAAHFSISVWWSSQELAVNHTLSWTLSRYQSLILTFLAPLSPRAMVPLALCDSGR